MTHAQTRLIVGDEAPQFTLDDETGRSVSLTDYRGKKVVIYFYPAAGTPGCTTQACDFRNNLNSLSSAGYELLGVSKDSTSTLVRFKKEQELEFPLLSDPDLRVHHAFGAYGEKILYGKKMTGVLRSTFVIDENGIVVLALYNVKATGHVASLLKKLDLAFQDSA